MKHNVGEVTAASMHYRYIGRGKVRLTLDTEAGEKVSYIISSKTMIGTVNQVVTMFRNNRRDILSELGV